MTRQEKALRTIEGMILAYCPGISSTADKLLNQIYAYAHVAINECDNKHPTWLIDMNNDYKRLKKDGVI